AARARPPHGRGRRRAACARRPARARRGCPRPRAAWRRRPRRACAPPRRWPPSRSREGALPFFCDQRLRERVELALEHAVELMLRQLDAMVGDAVLREVVGADLLRALACADLRAARRIELRALQLELALVQTRAQNA